METNTRIHTFQRLQERQAQANKYQPASELSPKTPSGRKFEGEGVRNSDNPHGGNSYGNLTKLIAILYRRSFLVRATAHCSPRCQEVNQVPRS